MTNNTKKEFIRIRPAARHILAIGRDLIKDSLAALIELIKNAYDADAECVSISFEVIENQSNDKVLKIIVKDDGHGMTYDTVVNKWMIPSTTDKLKRKYSPGKMRLMQGRKGIGRYSTAILGDEMWMETVDKAGIKTQVLINWQDFEVKLSEGFDAENDIVKNEKFLDEVEIPIESFQTAGEKSGTVIDITGSRQYLDEWSGKNIDILIKELRKIVTAIMQPQEADVFDIQLSFKNFPIDRYNETIHIEPYWILELFDYRLFGTVQEIKIKDLDINHFTNKNKFLNAREKALKNGIDRLLIADYTYENKCTNGIPDEIFKDVVEIHEGLNSGKIEFDIRVFDRDPEAIENLINKTSNDPDTKKDLDEIGKGDAKKLLNEMCGVSIYRKGFRIRPYGEAGYDWLLLDKRRVQEPTIHIGSNQIIGFVNIEAEEHSHLEEKSARDGLKENAYYFGLKDIITKNLQALEERRYQYRIKTNRGRPPSKIEEELQKLFPISALEVKVIKNLIDKGVKNEDLEDLREAFKEAKEETEKTVDKFRDTIARYEGQVTIGKVIMLLLHEGRKPLSTIKNQIPHIHEYIGMIRDEASLNELLPIIKSLSDDVVKGGDSLIHLFERLQPLAVKTSKPKYFLISKVLESVIRVYENQIRDNGIQLSLPTEKGFQFFGREYDFYIILTNLMDNSLYWLQQSYKDTKQISINVFQDEEELVINFKDNGPGIEKHDIESGEIFRPGFSKKEDGTGLGLSISGEAALRNKGKLLAVYKEDGAYLKAIFKIGDEHQNE